MMRKFYISLLAVVFFVSTTSLPISIHLCSMMGKSGAKTCKMCAARKAEIQKSCCSNDISNGPKIKSAGFKCCSEKIIDSSVKENYIGNSNSIKDLNSFKYLSAIILSPDVISITSTNIHFDNIHSPPLINSNPVYIINSIFLI
jgi:hypothetical protein